MRITRNIFIILGILLIVFNLIGFVAGASPFLKDPIATLGEKTGYFIGSNLFIITGLIFLLVSFWLNKKLKKRKGRQLVDSLFNDEAG